MTVIWGSTMFVSPDGRRFHCLFYVEATHWTLVSRSLPLNSSPGCSLSAVDRHQVVWFAYLIKRTPKKEQSFLTRDVNLNCASHLVFLQAVINVSVCPCCVSPPRQGETPPPPSVIFTASTLPLTSAGLLQSVWSHDVFVSPCRVLGKRKRDSYVRALGWPVKAPLFPVLSSARLTSSSWSAAYVWTATTTLKSFPACTLSVRGEFSCGTSSGLLLEGVW